MDWHGAGCKSQCGPFVGFPCSCDSYSLGAITTQYISAATGAMTLAPVDVVVTLYGPEMVPNGDFSAGLTDVTYSNADPTDCVTILSTDTLGGIRVTRGAGGIVNAPYFSVSVEIGKTYKREITVLGGSVSGGRCYVVAQRGAPRLTAGLGAGTYSQTFECTSTGLMTAGMYPDGNQWVEVDDFSIKEVL